MRPTRDQSWCAILQELRKKSTCLRRQTAALVVDVHNRLLSTGFNGVAPGFPHCSEGFPCYPDAGPNSRVSGDAGNETTRCQAGHAENNSLIWLPDPRLAYAMYATNLPCFSCAKAVLQTAIEYVCVIEDYPDHRGLDLLLQKNGMEVRIGDELWRRSPGGGYLRTPMHGSEAL
jgi:dCMP deaminase